MTRRDCEVLVIGAGPAGIAAACAGGESGKRVILADENPAPGGQIWRAESQPYSTRVNRKGPAGAWFDRLARSGAATVSGASAFDADAKSRVVRFERERDTLEVRYESLVLATGARERFLPFPGWTLPGIFGAGGLQALVKGGLPVEGRRIVVAGTGPLLLAAAGMLGQRGAQVLMVLEQARWTSLARFGLTVSAFPGKLIEAVTLFIHSGGVPFRPGWWICEAGGAGQLEWVEITNGQRRTRVACDMLACGYGLVPNTEFAQLLGCGMTAPRASRAARVVEVDQWQRTSLEGIYACGELSGIGGAELSLEEGCVAGYATAGRRSIAQRHFPARERYRRFAREMEAAFALREELKTLAKPDTITCRCEDVAAGQLLEFGSWREAKLASRCGMGPCQGRVCGPAVEFLFGWDAASVRPPLATVRLESLADPQVGSVEV